MVTIDIQETANDILLEQPSSTPEKYCSYAVTGPNEAFQAIYVCRTCTSSNNGDSSSTSNDSVCICQACADHCHHDHEGLVYIGTGPSYCDCNKLKGGYCCRILKQSIQKASQLGIEYSKDLPHRSPLTESYPKDNNSIDEAEAYVRDAYTIAALENTALCNRLKYQAQELVKHSKSTFWLDATSDESTFCDLELLAWTVFRQHLNHYDGLLRSQKRNHVGLESPTSFINDQVTTLPSPSCVGAEWWVQVKSVSLPPPLDETLAGIDPLAPYNNGSEAIDLHYDKDENLAESFGLGSFPVLSTVTYLTKSCDAPPTIVFNTQYEISSDAHALGAGGASITEMTISHPSRGKHLVFDGRLLHGAPTHFALRPFPCTTRGSQKEVVTEVGDDDDGIRVTFLVNLWLNHKPAGISVLPNNIREEIQKSILIPRHADVKEPIDLVGTHFEPQPIPLIELKQETELPLPLRGRIVLPFVGGKETTWGSKSDDEEAETDAAMVLVTYPPPKNAPGTFLVNFGPGLEAYLDYQDGEASTQGGEIEDDDGYVSENSKPDKLKLNDVIESHENDDGHERGDDDDSFFGPAGISDPNDTNKSSTANEVSGGKEMNDGFSLAEQLSCQERYRIIGYHEGYHNGEHQNEHTQRGFQSGYQDSYEISKRIGNLLGHHSSSILRRIMESSLLSSDNNDLSRQHQEHGSSNNAEPSPNCFQNDKDADHYLFVVKQVRDFLISKTGDKQVPSLSPSSMDANYSSLYRLEQVLHNLLTTQRQQNTTSEQVRNQFMV